MTTPMNPDLQLAESRKYTLRPLIFIPLPDDRFYIFEAYGARRVPLRIISAADIPTWLASTAEELRQSAEETIRKSAPRFIDTSSLSLSDIDLGL